MDSTIILRYPFEFDYVCFIVAALLNKARNLDLSFFFFFFLYWSHRLLIIYVQVIPLADIDYEATKRNLEEAKVTCNN